MKKRKGFTLIELLVVVAIMGLLATLAVTALNTARAKARDARRVSDIKQVQTALELYYMDQNGYPDTPASIDVFEGYCLDSSGFEENCSGTVYMGQVPSNPEPRNDGSGASQCSDVGYSYVQDESGMSYHIDYCLGEATGGIDAGDRVATPTGLDEQDES